MRARMSFAAELPPAIPATDPSGGRLRDGPPEKARPMVAHVHQFPCLTDNYGVLVHDPDTRRTASVDAPDATAVLAALERTGWVLTDILVTHHHADHTQGLPELKERHPDVRIVGPAKEADKIGLLDLKLGEGDYVKVGVLKARILEVPGHTLGHIAYSFDEQDLLFAGDTLFALGCGRPFETPPGVLYRSLMKLATNPFVRADEPDVKAALGMAGADAVDVFAELRARKNRG